MASSESNDHVWALVLAGGDGTRLRSLTTTATGVAVPKQYCSLRGDITLLESALLRAQTLTAPQRICTVVAEQHQQWWQPLLSRHPQQHIVAQPANRGTAIGIMLPLLHIMRHDPQARIVMLPSDHHVRDELRLSNALQQAATQLWQRPDKLVILGIEPDEADEELGYVLPGQPLGDGVAAVASFIEKPPREQARQLLAQGALWNTFIVAASAPALWRLFAQRCAHILQALHTVLAVADTPQRQRLLTELYARLPGVDFSREILQGVESLLTVLAVPACGWTDLGTPRRIREVLHRWPHAHSSPSIRTTIPLTLAAHAGYVSGNAPPQAATG